MGGPENAPWCQIIVKNEMAPNIENMKYCTVACINGIYT